MNEKKVVLPCFVLRGGIIGGEDRHFSFVHQKRPVIVRGLFQPLENFGP